MRGGRSMKFELEQTKLYRLLSEFVLAYVKTIDWKY